MDSTQKTEIYLSKIGVRIDQQLITADTVVHPDGFCGLVFLNQGKADALLMNSTTIAPGDAHNFNFDANEEITSDMSLAFPDKTHGECRVVLTKIYKTIIG